jgi:hypothetical protein
MRTLCAPARCEHRGRHRCRRAAAHPRRGARTASGSTLEVPELGSHEGVGPYGRKNALQYAEAAGYLPNAHIFLDLEGILVGATANSVITFANDWATTIVAAGYSAGCYVGYDVPLSAQQLYDLPNFNSYGSDAGPRAVATRGLAMKQQAQIQMGGENFDPDVVKADLLGDTPLWIA